MNESSQGLNTQYEDYLLNLPTPTQADISDTHIHGYSHFSAAT
jgi:hypothetical protein